MGGGRRVMLVCLLVAALAGLAQPQATSVEPTTAPSGQRFMSYDQADLMYATLYNGLHCSGDAVGFSIKAHVLNQCLPSNDASRKYHPSVRRCFVGAKKVSIIEDTYADFACSPSTIDPRGSMPNAPDGGILYHGDICTKNARGMPGQSSRASCQLLPSSLASRDMLLVQSFLHATCSGAPTPAGQNPEVMALFLNTCTFFIDADRVKLRRKLVHVSGDGFSSNLVLKETRYTHADTHCRGAPMGDPLSVVYPAVDGTGTCLPDPLLPKRFYLNVLRTTSLVDSAPDWAMLPTWAAPTASPTPLPTAPSPRPSAVPTPSPTQQVVSSVDILVVAGGGGGGNANSQRASAGGAGGLIYISGFPVAAGMYSISVAGTALVDTQGSDSVFSGQGRTLKALGGGHGQWFHDQGLPRSGGSGASGWYSRGGGYPSGPYAGGSATQPSTTNDGISSWTGTGFGHDGGVASTDGQPYSGGGGGAGGAGADFNDPNGAVGGVGMQLDISGTATYYAGGGGAACYMGSCRYAGGLGGGGKGDNSGSTTNADRHGVANTGGGGGAGGSGGSGIIIFRYPDSYRDLSSVSSGLTYTLAKKGGYKIYSFTAGAGTFAFFVDPNAPTPAPTTPFPTILSIIARYIRWSQTGGSTSNGSNHFCELQALTSSGVNRALNLGQNGGATQCCGSPGLEGGSLQSTTNGITGTGDYIGWGSGPTGILYDLGAVYNDIAVIKFWNYYGDGRTYYGSKIEVSTDGSTWTTLYGPQNTASSAGGVAVSPR